MKKIVSLLLAAVLLCGLSAMPTALASEDGGVDEAVTVLTGLGIVSGYEDGQYHPERTLARSEFCKLAIAAEGHGDRVSQGAYRSLFSDVSGSHWALGYINLAYDEGLMAGNGDGTFSPDANVTVEQAATVCLRLLGYSDSEIGRFWPEDYVVKAQDVGLLDGVSASGSQTLYRGDAAVMLYNLMGCDTAQGQPFYRGLAASTIDSAILLDNDATAADGTEHTLRLYANDNIRYCEQAIAVAEEFVGRSGTVLLNRSGRVCGFIPGEGYSRSVDIAEVSATGVTDADGNSYSISSNTRIWEEDEYTNFSALWFDMEGRTLTMYYTETGTLALAVISEQVAYEGLMLTGYYESASPNTSEPVEITLLGHTFEVADDAELGDHSVGDRITVELNGAGEVCRLYSASEKRVDVIALLTNAQRGEFEHLSGLKLTAEISNTTAASNSEGNFVRLNATDKGACSIYELNRDISYPLNVTARTIGRTPLASDAKIYDTAKGASAVEVDIDELLTDSVDAGDILYVSTNARGEAELVILDDVTGDCYNYGFYRTKTSTERTGTITMEYFMVAVENSAGVTAYQRSGWNLGITDGHLGGATNTEHWSDASLMPLTKVENVARTDFVGTDVVVIDGLRVPVAANVQVYNSETETWTDMASAKAYSANFTVYYSGAIGGDAKVRVIVI